MKESLRSSLASIVGETNVLSAPKALREYAEDSLRPYRGFQRPTPMAKPLAVVRPGSSEQVAAIVRLAGQMSLPLIPYGGGSGLMGGALSVKGGIVIDMKAMNRILDIGRQDRLVRTEAGILLQDLEAELNKEGLILGHDPWSLSLATVGGAIATNGLGYRAAKYGSMGEQVLGLTVVLPQGDVLRTRAVPKTSVGLDLKHLFIGTEGCFGIITEATIRAFPIPEERIIRAYAFPSFEAGFKAATELFSLGLVPALLDYGETRRFPGVSKVRKKFYQEQGPTLYTGFEGPQEVVTAEMERADSICKARGGADLGAEEPREFWENRHWIAEQQAQHKQWDRLLGLAGNIKLDFVHLALPQGQVLEYNRRCREIMKRHRVHPLEWGIWTRPELFSMVMAVVSLTAERANRRMSQAIDELLALAQSMGGSMEYCHGVGLRLAHLMGGEHGIGLEVMQQIKSSLDPYHILNPGKLGL